MPKEDCDAIMFETFLEPAYQGKCDEYFALI